jgi:hypothetical protein
VCLRGDGVGRRKELVAFLSLNIYTQEELNADGHVFPLFHKRGRRGRFVLLIYRIISFRIFMVVLDALCYVLV